MDPLNPGRPEGDADPALGLGFRIRVHSVLVRLRGFMVSRAC